MGENDSTQAAGQGQADSAAAAARQPSVTHHTLETTRGTLEYVARAGWLTLRDGREKPVAEMFHVAYGVERIDERACDPRTRPVTFVFNGGPGAASAFLHVGALGPTRVVFNPDGTTPAPPVQLVTNDETWLHMSDLVFVDPIGTGYSRTLEAADKDKKDGDGDGDRKAYWQVKRDLESLGEFIQRYLTQSGRWSSPVFIAGESYGGYRVARLARSLQEDYGVGLSGAVLISPAIEFALLGGSDYDALFWVDTFPGMAAAARFHGRARVEAESDEAFRQAAERFARREMLPALAQGAAMPADERRAVYARLADFLGLPEDLVVRAEGRIPPRRFTRELLRDQRRVLGIYDASMAAVDAFPDREAFEGPDASLAGILRMFVGGINLHLRQNLGVAEDERDYRLLSYEVFESWRFENEGHMRQGFLGAMDDLRYGMALNPHLKVFITHGYFDLVTPYFSSSRLVDVMRLDPTLTPNLAVQHYVGGHMFYTWQESREAFFDAMRGFYLEAVRATAAARPQ